MPVKPRRWLIPSIKRFLIPEFQKRGFDLTPPIPSDDREVRITRPFGLLLRKAERGIEIIEIDIGRYNTGAFRISFGVIPYGGIDTYTGHVEANNVLSPQWLDRSYELYQFRPLWRWFKVRRWPWSKSQIGQEDYDKLATRVAGLIPEIEGALKHGTIGPHVRYIKMY